MPRIYPTPDDEVELRFLSDEVWLYDRAALRARFDAFEAFVDVVIDLLIETVGNHAPHLLPLDRTTQSLDRAEQVLKTVIDGGLDVPYDLMATRVSSYTGIVVQEAIGGEWYLCEDDCAESFGLPCIRSIPGLPNDYSFSPLEAVRECQDYSSLGHLRSVVEHLVRIANVR